MFFKDGILEFNFKGDCNLFKVMKNFDKDVIFKQFIKVYGEDNIKHSNTYNNQNALLTYLISNNYIRHLELDHIWNVHQSFGEKYDLD